MPTSQIDETTPNRAGAPADAPNGEPARSPLKLLLWIFILPAALLVLAALRD